MAMNAGRINVVRNLEQMGHNTENGFFVTCWELICSFFQKYLCCICCPTNSVTNSGEAQTPTVPASQRNTTSIDDSIRRPSVSIPPIAYPLHNNTGDNTQTSDAEPVTSNNAVDPRRAYTTQPHRGLYHGYQGGTYKTRDVSEHSVEVSFSNSMSPVVIEYSYIETDSNTDAFNALENKTGCVFSNFDEMKSIIRSGSMNLPYFRIVDGDVVRQVRFVERVNCNDSRVVILNASQLNYQEQLDQYHDIKDGIQDVYRDRTFGPGVVKTQEGGPEFLAHLLIDSNRIPFSGALCNFFNAAEVTRSHIQAIGGYYLSDMTVQQWHTLTHQLRSSTTKVQGLRWHKVNGTTVYQTGAINSGGGLYSHLHRNGKPTEAFEFAVIFLQFRNALLEETNIGGTLEVHTTLIGEGVFGNSPFVSMLALCAALISLPEVNRNKIRTVNVGTYRNMTNVWNHLGERVLEGFSVGD